MANFFIIQDSLLFWKNHEKILNLMAPLAKKYLSIPACSGSVERMFNISGHIISCKRRCMGEQLFGSPCFCKLNEMYIV